MIVQRPTLMNARPAVEAGIDRAFAQLTRDLFTPVRRVPAIDAAWRDGSLVLTVDLPGTPSDAVGVEVAARTLTVSVRGDDGRPAWQRSIRLGSSLDAEQVSARYLDGRLTVTVPELAAPASRTVAIDTTRPEPAPAAVEAASTESPAAAHAAEDQPDTPDTPAT